MEKTYKLVSLLDNIFFAPFRLLNKIFEFIYNCNHGNK